MPLSDALTERRMSEKSIVVNTRLLLPGKLDGIGWFTFHTLRLITTKHPEQRFVFLFDRPWSEEFVFNNNVTPIALFPQARHPLLYYWWFEHSVPAALKKHKAELFLSPDGYLSLNTAVKQVAVMHDINFEHYPGDLPLLTSLYYRHYFPRFARKAERLATVSEFSKSDIVERYNVKSEKIDVVYNGVNELYKPLAADRIEQVRLKHTNGCPYFLFVGMLHRRKNIANLLRAFDTFKSNHDSNVKLLIVGHRKWWTSEMEETYKHMSHAQDVVFTGRLPIEELVEVTASALALTYVSYFEGFGVPIIESMRAGVPVITANVTSMPEVAHDAALLCDPFSTESIAESMAAVWKDPDLRASCVQKGLTRANDFSWNKTADLLWDSLIKARG